MASFSDSAQCDMAGCDREATWGFQGPKIPEKVEPVRLVAKVGLAKANEVEHGLAFGVEDDVPRRLGATGSRLVVSRSGTKKE